MTAVVSTETSEVPSEAGINSHEQVVSEVGEDNSQENGAKKSDNPSDINLTVKKTENGLTRNHAPPLQTRQGSNESTSTEGSSTDADEEPEGDTGISKSTERGDETKAQYCETEAGAEISALVNYVQPIHFVSFDESKGKLN